MNDIYFQGFWRMDWGLGNPNKTATLIATLMVAVWILTYFHKWFFWVALAIFTILGVCLVHTFSRGGLIAAVIGFFPLIWLYPRPWPWDRVCVIAIATLVIVCASIHFRANERYSQGLLEEDKSITNRWEIWKITPSMMVDAPDGWGWGKSGQAYMDWYQPINRNEGYRTLVNTHLTWLVEAGWVGRFLYVAGWVSILIVCFPRAASPRERWIAIPLGVWIAFFAGSTFSAVGESLLLWAVPMLALFSVVCWRAKSASWPSIGIMMIAPAFSGFILLTIATLAPPTIITKRKHIIKFGEKEPVTWLVVDRDVLGSAYPRSLRRAKYERLSLGIVEDFQDLPGEGVIALIIAGFPKSLEANTLKKNTMDLNEILLINPMFSRSKLFTATSNVNILHGEFVAGFESAEWQALGAVEVLPGVSNYVPEWANLRQVRMLIER